MTIFASSPWHSMCLAAALWLLIASPARADYTLWVLSQGKTNHSTRVGDQVVLDVVVTSPAADYHDSAIFKLNFSTPGLLYQAYRWNDPYPNGTSDDDSKPLSTVLPLVLNAATMSGQGYPADAVDIELSNIAGRSAVGTGTLAQVTLKIPDDYAGTNRFSILPEVDTFAFPFNTVNAVAGPPFQLNILPTYRYWMNQSFQTNEVNLSAPDQDPNQDGLINAVAYGFDLAPKSAIDPANLPQMHF